jgi:hypothetical protein
MSNDKMREEFEEWFLAAYDKGTGRPHMARGEKDYFNKRHRQAWAAWQASRAALVIELPVSFGWDGYEGGNLVFKDEVVKSIGTAGVKVAP